MSSALEANCGTNIAPQDGRCCVVCHGSMRLLFSCRDHARPEDSRAWDVLWCDTCSYGRTAGNLSEEEIASLYPPDYYTHQVAMESGQETSWPDRLRVHIAWRLDRTRWFAPGHFPSPGKLCEIGCGNGNILERLRDRGFTVEGIEPDPQARQLAERVCKVHAGTGEEIPVEVERESFDYVLMQHVMEHTLRPSLVLANAWALLKSGGHLIIEVPNNRALGFWKFKAFWPWTDCPRHRHYFTAQSLCRIIEESSFQVVETEYVGFERQFRNEWLRAQDRIWGTIADPSTKRPNFRRSAWWLLARCVFASPPQKYDTIRVTARKG